MSAELIYKTTSPDALAWILDFEKRDQDNRAVVREFMARVNTEIPPLEGEKRDLMALNDRPIGITYSYEEFRQKGWNFRDNLPTGWRLEKRYTNTLVPHQRTAEGKAWKKQIDALPLLSLVKDASDHLGTPEVIFGGSMLYRPGMQIDRDENDAPSALYLLWGSQSVARNFFSEIDKAGVNVDVQWEQLPLSAWHLRLERIAAEKAAA